MCEENKKHRRLRAVKISGNKLLRTPKLFVVFYASFWQQPNFFHLFLLLLSQSHFQGPFGFHKKAQLWRNKRPFPELCSSVRWLRPLSHVQFWPVLLHYYLCVLCLPAFGRKRLQNVDDLSYLCIYCWSAAHFCHWFLLNGDASNGQPSFKVSRDKVWRI